MADLHFYSDAAVKEDRVSMPADDLTAMVLQVFLIGFAAGAIVATVVCWILF